MSRTDFRGGTTHAARAGALITGLLDLARRKSGIVNFVGCACQGAPQVILGIGVAARERGLAKRRMDFTLDAGAPWESSCLAIHRSAILQSG